MDPHEVQQIDEGIFTIFSDFGRGESVDIIARAESIGPLGGLCADAKCRQMMTEIRNNDRVVFRDNELEDEMWNRIRLLLPEINEQVPCGLDPKLRVYRYLPG